MVVSSDRLLRSELRADVHTSRPADVKGGEEVKIATLSRQTPGWEVSEQKETGALHPSGAQQTHCHMLKLASCSLRLPPLPVAFDVERLSHVTQNRPRCLHVAS